PATRRTRDRATQSDQVALRSDSDHFEVLDRDPFVAEVTGHPHALHNSTWGRTRADRAWGSPAVRLTVGLRATPEIVPLHDASEALTLGLADDIDPLASNQHADVDPLTNAEPIDIRHRHFAQRFDRRHAILQVP